MRRNPPWWHSPGITFSGRCRLRSGHIVTLIPFGSNGTPVVYRAVECAMFFDIDGNVIELGRQWDIVENLENLTVREK